MAFKFHLIFIKHQTFNFKLKKASACDERKKLLPRGKNFLTYL